MSEMVKINYIICHSYFHRTPAKQCQGKEAFFKCMNEMERHKVMEEVRLDEGWGRVW
jgi:hypothetical protein